MMVNEDACIEFGVLVYQMKCLRPTLTIKECIETAIAWPGKPGARHGMHKTKAEQELYMTDNEILERMRRWVYFFGDPGPRG